MGAAGKSIKGLGAADIATFTAEGSITLPGGVQLVEGDIKVSPRSDDCFFALTPCSHIDERFVVWQVLRDFKVPEGYEAGDLDANGDGELLVVLDLRADDGLAEAGLVRELVMR